MDKYESGVFSAYNWSPFRILSLKIYKAELVLIIFVNSTQIVSFNFGNP